MPDRQYKTRCERDGNDRYSLSYGKGSKKLIGAVKREVNGVWITLIKGNESGTFKMKREAVAAWTEWAVLSYGGGKGQVPTEPLLPPTPAMPPTYRPRAKAKSAFPVFSGITLDENQRAFFAELGNATEELTLHRLQQCRVELRRLCGIEDSYERNIPRTSPVGDRKQDQSATSQAESAHNSVAENGEQPEVPRIEATY